MPPGSISPALTLVLFRGANFLGTVKSLFACALLEKSQKRQKTTISNASSISRNAKPNAASMSHRVFEELKRAPKMEKAPIFARLVGHGLWIIVTLLYWWLANYGRNFARPLALLFVSVFIFHFGYALILAPLKNKVDPANKDDDDQAVWMLALGNAVPFVGHLSIDAGIKKSLYCPGDVSGERSPIPPLGVQVLVIVQNFVSIALIFFFGLAVRNYFKIK